MDCLGKMQEKLENMCEDCPEGWVENSAQVLISSRFPGLRLDVSRASIKEF